MGHPVNVAFFSRDHEGSISPWMYCPYGGEHLYQDLRKALDLCGVPGTAAVSRELFLQWALKYGKHNVCVFNLDAPGLTVGMPAAEVFQVSLDHLRESVRKGGEFVAVDLDEFVVIGRHEPFSLEQDLV